MTATSAISKNSTESEPDENEATSIPRDECFDLLSNHRRRYALHYLEQTESGVTLGDLSEQIAAWENEIPVEEISYDQRKRVYTSLQQVHLPRMDDANVVEFDDREGVVEIGPAADDLDIYLEIVEGRGIPWAAFYLGLSLLSIGVVTLFVLGAGPLATVSALGPAVFVTTTFLVTSLAHLYLTRTEMRLGEGELPPEHPP